MDEIEKAAEWCRRNGPHKFEFLNQIRAVLQREEIQLARMGLGEAIRNGAVKRTPVLNTLTPSQALRLLECYRRAVVNTSDVWQAKSIEEMDKIQADTRRDGTIAKIREQLKKQREGGDGRTGNST